MSIPKGHKFYGTEVKPNTTIMLWAGDPRNARKVQMTVSPKGKSIRIFVDGKEWDAE